jgi:nucleoside-diphosphate-sugar epimerase
MFHLSAWAEVIPVVRRVPALAGLSRFQLDPQMADVRDGDSLTQALSGCDAVVDCTVGMPGAIEAGARVLIPAAKAAGVRRVVYLSTASVYGQNPAAGSDEDTALSDRQEMAYNNAKVRAERRLFADAKKFGIELFVLRPSIVYGPRDRWISTLVNELEHGTAWLIEGGQGICNTIYVDNLVEAVRCCLLAPAHAAGRAYLVDDGEEVTWNRLYESTARGVGIAFETVHRIATPAAPVRKFTDRLNAIRVLPASQRLISTVPGRLKGIIKGAILGLRPQALPNPWQLPEKPEVIHPSREMVLLQQCRHRFPQTRATKELGYKPNVSFEEGLRRTLAWIEWARS